MDGRSPEQQVSECLAVVRDIVEQQRLLASELHRLLKEQGIVLRSHQRLTEEQRQQMREYYLQNIFPWSRRRPWIRRTRSHSFPTCRSICW